MGQATSCMGEDRSTWTVSFLDDDNKSFQLTHNGMGNPKTVAVTGANGFIGSHMVKLLLGKGYKVRGTVHHKKPELVDFLTLLPNAAKNLTLHEKELMHNGCFDDVFQGCDCVFHVASPTLKDQREMKEPDVEMTNTARVGTLNAMGSAAKAGVKTFFLTSSMCSAIPKTNTPSGGLPAIIDETLWANPEYLMNKRSYYAASKTLAEKAAVEFVRKMPKDSAFRLVRICPTFTVGPMLQKTRVNSSMERFARICAGKHHHQIPNRSISLVDVRDTAAHHIAAYEKGFEGRFFSLTEGWNWTLVYDALKIMIPDMKCPKPLPNGTKHRPARKYSTSRMEALGGNMKSFMNVLSDAVEAIKDIDISHNAIQCHKISKIPMALIKSFRRHTGYYKSEKADGAFFMIETLANFVQNEEVTYLVFVSWFFPGYEQPKVLQVESDSSATFIGGKLILPYIDLSLTFTPLQSSWSVQGTIASNVISAVSSVVPVPYNNFGTTFMNKDSSSSVKLTFGGTNNTITDHNGKTHSNFTYDYTKRLFEYQEVSGTNDLIVSRMYLNAAAGHGLRLSFVEFNPDKLPGTTNFYYQSPNFTTKSGNVSSTGARDLAAFAGFYPNVNGNGSFVSIVGKASGTSDPTVAVGICQDGSNSIEYTSFNFDKVNNTLTFPQEAELTLNFDTQEQNTTVTVSSPFIPQPSTATNSFSPAPVSAFGPYKLTGVSPDDQTNYSLEITDGSIVYMKNGTNVFEPTTLFEYNAVEQDAKVGEYVFNLTYNADKGISCGVTTVDESGMPTGLEAVLFAFPTN